MKKLIISTLLSLAIMGCSGGGATESSYLKRAWQSSGENLSVPESVVYDTRRALLYVSNVNSQRSGNPWVDNAGFISQLDKQGKVLHLKWVTGLKAPKGLTVEGNMLYVADLDQVVKIDTLKGVILERFQAPKGVDKLNDIVYDTRRNLIYVSNSSNKELYAVDVNGKFSLLYHKEQSQKAEQNGLYINDDRLIMQGTVGYLKSLGLEGKGQVKNISESINIPIDGITKYKEKGYLISTWGGEIHFVGKNGTSKLLLDSKPTRSADIFYSSVLDLLLVPDFNNHIVAYNIKDI